MRRVDYIAVAKGIRDSGISRNSRNLVVSSILKNLVDKNPIMDKDSFRAMANADIEHYDKKVGFLLDELQKDE